LKMFLGQLDTFRSFLLQEMLYYLNVHCGCNILKYPLWQYNYLNYIVDVYTMLQWVHLF
jgi:hypothetical protein